MNNFLKGFSFLDFVFFITGVIMLVSTVRRRIRKERCTVQVGGTVVLIKRSFGSHFDEVGSSTTVTYTNVYEYTYMGEKYRTCDEMSKGFNTSELGDHKDFYINPNKPSEVYIWDFGFIIFDLFGIICILLSMRHIFNMSSWDWLGVFLLIIFVLIVIDTIYLVVKTIKNKEF